MEIILLWAKNFNIFLPIFYGLRRFENQLIFLLLVFSIKNFQLLLDSLLPFATIVDLK